MKLFHCDECGQLLYFENSVCMNCGVMLAYLPDVAKVNGLKPSGNGETWLASTGKSYRLCRNYQKYNICNWAVVSDDPNPYCISCRLTRTTPDLTVEGNLESWQRLELAKRRLVYTVIALNLPLRNKVNDPQHGLMFHFLADEPGAAPIPVLTGHEDGVITINVAEADDAERERRRVALREPYRTPLGHFRHEIGHYYWDLLIQNTDRLDGFRTLFGDERIDYATALRTYYEKGAPPDWSQRFISAYSTSHPWEDWAETWAHYMHMADTLETAAASGLTLTPPREDEPSLAAMGEPPWPFDLMVKSWFPLTLVLNNINRGLGLRDVYPFLMPKPVTDKLRFVHEVIRDAGRLQPAVQTALN